MDQCSWSGNISYRCICSADVVGDNTDDLGDVRLVNPTGTTVLNSTYGDDIDFRFAISEQCHRLRNGLSSTGSYRHDHGLCLWMAVDGNS